MPHAPVSVVADADPAVNLLIVAVLSREGYDVRRLAGPWELGGAPLENVALVVLGGRGRGVRASDAARALRAAGNATPLILLVNSPDPAAATLAAADPTVRTLDKPFRAADLAALAAELLGRG
ncbi:MAG TPA: hypothetical protein VD866_17320 [Urbifossiella sp.]|nr:hypothetical protein [Urbifossiella sp.]